MKAPIFWEVKWLFLLFFLTSPCGSHAQRYIKVAVEMETYHFNTDADFLEGKNRIVDKYALTCQMGTKEWRIDIPVIENDLQLAWYFDGTNLVEDLTSEDPFEKERRADRKKGLVSTVYLWTSRDGCPLDDARINMAWLVFCSGAYLKRDGRIIPNPMTSPRHRPDGFAYADKTTTFGDELGLPRTLELFASDRLFAVSVTNEVFGGSAGDVELWKRGMEGFKWDLPDGALGFRYVVTESTNFAGWTIPVAFEWFGRKRTTGEIIPGGKGHVTSLRESSEPLTPVDPAIVTHVFDRRLIPPTNNALLEKSGAGKTATQRTSAMRGSVNAGFSTPPFTAEFNAVTSEFKPNVSKPFSRIEKQAMFSCSNGWWRLEMLTTDAGNGTRLVESCMSIPGGVREITYAPDLLDPQGRKPTPTATAGHMNFPAPGREPMFVSWLAFCPKPELPFIDSRSMHGLIYVPGCEEADVLEDERNVVTYSISYYDLKSSFVKSLRVRNEGVYVDLRQSPNGFEPIFYEYPQPLRKGFVEFEYDLLATTNYQNYSFPAHAVMKRMYPAFDRANPERMSVHSITEIRLTKIGELNPDPTELIPRKVLAMDFRPTNLPKHQSVDYFVTNDVWRASSILSISD